MIAHVDGKPILISLGSMALYGYDPQTGKELRRAEAVGTHSGSCRPVVATVSYSRPWVPGANCWPCDPTDAET